MPNYGGIGGGGGGGGAVSSVFTRTGNVVAQAGDYTPAQVSAIPTAAAGAAGGVAVLDGSSHVPAVELALAVLASAVGAVGGVASLDGAGNVPAAQLGNGVLASALGAASGVATLDVTSNVPGGQLGNAVLASAAGNPSGVATLDGSGNVPLAQLGNAPGATGVASITAGANVVLRGTASNPIIDAIQADPTVPTGYFYQSTQRGPGVSTATLATQISGEVSLWAVALVAGQVLTQIEFASGTTALATGTHQWFALYDSGFNALAATIDGTNTAWAASAMKNLTIGWTFSAGTWHANTTFTIPTTGLYYIGVMIAATTVPTLTGGSLAGFLSQLAPPVSASDTTHTGLTTPNSSPGTLTNSGGAPSGFPYFLLG